MSDNKNIRETYEVVTTTQYPSGRKWYHIQAKTRYGRRNVGPEFDNREDAEAAISEVRRRDRQSGKENWW